MRIILVIRYLQWVTPLHDRLETNIKITAREVDHLLSSSFSESPDPVLDQADLGVEAFKDGIGPLYLEIVGYLNGIAHQHFSELLHLLDVVLLQKSRAMFSKSNRVFSSYSFCPEQKSRSFKTSSTWYFGTLHILVSCSPISLVTLETGMCLRKERITPNS